MYEGTCASAVVVRSSSDGAQGLVPARSIGDPHTPGCSRDAGGSTQHHRIIERTVSRRAKAGWARTQLAHLKTKKQRNLSSLRRGVIRHDAGFQESAVNGESIVEHCREPCNHPVLSHDRTGRLALTHLPTHSSDSFVDAAKLQHAPQRNLPRTGHEKRGGLNKDGGRKEGSDARRGFKKRDHGKGG